MPLHNWKVFSLRVSALIGEERREVEARACKCIWMHVCVTAVRNTICIPDMVVVMFYVAIMVCFSL